MSENLTDRQFWERFYSGRNRGDGKRAYRIRSVSAKHIAAILKRFLPRETWDYFEFGCGDSQWIPYFHRVHGYSVSGVDYSPTGVRLLEERLKANRIQAQIYCNDFKQLPETLFNRFHVGASFGVIEHFENPAEILTSFARVINESGLLITVIPRLTGIQGFIQERLVNREIFGKHVPMTMTQLKEAHIRAGLEVVYASEIGCITLGLNFGAHRKILSLLYRVYSRVLNTLLRFILPVPLVNALGLGSALLIISRKGEHNGEARS